MTYRNFNIKPPCPWGLFFTWDNSHFSDWFYQLDKQWPPYMALQYHNHTYTWYIPNFWSPNLKWSRQDFGSVVSSKMTANTSFRISSLKNLGIFPSWRMLNPANEICWNNLNIHNKVINHTIAIEWCIQGTRWSTHKFVKYHKRFKIKKLVVTSAGWHGLGTIYNMWRFYTKEISTITTIYWFILYIGLILIKLRPVNGQWPAKFLKWPAKFALCQSHWPVTFVASTMNNDY